MNIKLSAMWYNIILLMVFSVNHGQNEFSRKNIKIFNEIKEITDDTKTMLFDRGPEGYAILIKGDTYEELSRNQKDLLVNIYEILNKHEKIRYFGGIGISVNRLSELPISFEKASHAFAHRYLSNENRILDSAEIDDGTTFSTEETNYSKDSKDSFNISSVDAKQMDRNKIIEFLKCGEKNEAIFFVEEFFKGFDTESVKSNMFRQYIAMDVFFCVSEFVDDMKFSKNEIEPLDVINGTLRSIETTKQYIIRIIEKALELRDNAASNKYKSIVDEAKKFIDENYSNEGLSLNELASHVNFSPNHLSMIFSQQTGQTFIKYLTDYRLNKAMEMLRCTGKKSSIIGMEVGYKDPHYFSFLFKKNLGMTPTQYRGGKNTEGED